MMRHVLRRQLLRDIGIIRLWLGSQIGFSLGFIVRFGVRCGVVSRVAVRNSVSVGNYRRAIVAGAFVIPQL